MAKEIRCPIHGFIKLDDWEWEIINHPVFQRLRRIRQLAWTDMVYPGAMHTRFEHSLGVMHTATMMFDELFRRHDKTLREWNMTDGKDRYQRIVRLAALLHDVGHSPFSHAGEDLFPAKPDPTKRYKHEEYSAALIKILLRDVIEDHPFNDNFGIKVSDIADLITGENLKFRQLFWRTLISSQCDADRSDYLLRDSYHLGVQYGMFDLKRLITSLGVTEDPETNNPIMIIEESGLHSAESLLIARYMMFTQVYFHKTRAVYDKHITEVLRSLLREEYSQQDGVFPPPTDEQSLIEYLTWTDWKVLGMLSDGRGGKHRVNLVERDHYRVIYESPELASPDDLRLAETIQHALRDFDVFASFPRTSWYKMTNDEIKILRGSQVMPLSSLSPVIKGLKESNQVRLYVPSIHRSKAKEIVQHSYRSR